MSAFKKARKLEEGIISESKMKVRKVESHEEDTGLECYHSSDGSPVNIDVDKEITGNNQKDSRLALLPNKFEEKGLKTNGERGVGKCTIFLSLK